MGFIFLVEGLTELFVNVESIVYKKISKKIIGKKIWAPKLIRDALKCGWCFSLHLSVLFNLYWLFTQYWLAYPLFVFTTWRLSNVFHTFNSILMRQKMFMQP